MKLPILLATILLAGSAFAQEQQAIWPMPETLPTTPAGVNSAAYPSPKLDWLERIKNTHAKVKTIGHPIDLIFDGDSITDGWQSTGKTVWAERYGQLNAFDFGISGDRTQHVLWRLSQGQVDDLHPKLIALMIGTNNLGSNTNEQIADGVKTIIADYQKRCPGAVILLQAIFPRAEKADDPLRARITAINQTLSQFGDGKKVIYVDFGSKFLEPDGTLTREIMPDFLHPSAKGYQIWADAIQPIISKYFPQAAAAK